MKDNERVLFPDVNPWDNPVDGADLLEAIVGYLQRYLVLPDHAADAIAAWAVCTWLRETVYFAPLLALLSPVKRSGKTLLLDLLRPIVYRGYLTAGIGVTPAVIFRLTDKHWPTLLIDEAEKLASDKEARDVIGLLNVGFRRGAKIPRCEGARFEIKSFDAYGFRALAAIGNLWDTVTDRAIVIRMSRKPKGADVARYLAEQADQDGLILARQMSRWVVDKVRSIELALAITPRPDCLHDRACDNWSSLFAVGMVAGQGWIERLKTAAMALSVAGEDEGDRRELLLLDIQGVFVEQGRPAFLTTAELLKALVALEGSPWGDLKGRELTKQKLASLLRPFGIKPVLRRDSYAVERGYELAAFTDTFARYLPSSPVGTVTSLQTENRYIQPVDSISGSDGCNVVTDQKGDKGCNKSEVGTLQAARDAYGPE